MIYYETKLTYTKEVGDGKMQKAKEVYLCRALSYADAEERIKEQMASSTFNGEMEIDIKKVKYVEIFLSENPQADKFYKAKVLFTTLEGDGDQLREKKTANLMLVQATDIDDALRSLNKALTSTASDTTVAAIQETLIMDYFDYFVADVQSAEEAL